MLKFIISRFRVELIDDVVGRRHCLQMSPPSNVVFVTFCVDNEATFYTPILSF